MKSKWILILSCSFLLFALSGCNQVEEVLDKVINLLDQELENNNDSMNEGNENDQSENNEGDNNTANNSKEPSENNSSETSTGTDNDMDNNDDNMNGVHEDSMLSLRGELRESGESEVDNLSLPNGFPLMLPSDWVLIEVVQTEPWEGTFCFEKNTLEWHTEDDDYEDGVDDPHTFHTNIYETIDEIEDNFRSYGYDITSDNFMDNSGNVHTTTYQFKEAGVSWTGEMVYFLHNLGDNSFSCAEVFLDTE